MSSKRLKRVLQDSNSSKAMQSLATDTELMKTNERLSEEVSVLRLRILELEQTANTDPLIPIYNRRALLREVRRAQAVKERYDIPSTLIFFDLNNFKAVNDKYGHRIGDSLLTQIGSELNTAIRDCDMVARLGGDEFGVLLFKTDEEVARLKAATLSCRISEQSVLFPEVRISVTACWGVAGCDPELSVEQILDRADRAMYLDKRRQG